MKTQVENQILESMKILINEGESLTTGDYYGTNPSVFKEFADVNGYKLEDVVFVYNKHEEELNELWKEVNS